MRRDPKGHGVGMSRRDFIKTSALGGTALMLPWGLASRLAYAKESPSVTKFVDPLPLPRTFRPNSSGEYVVGMKQLKQSVHSDVGPVTTVWGYGDADGFSTPGPTFEARRGQRTRVHWKNLLADDPNAPHFLKMDQSVLDYVHGAKNNRKTIVHLHGGKIPAAVDGPPEKTILPGESVTYDYDIVQEAATLWYHDHALGNTRLNVYMGLAGFFLVRDANEIAWIENSAGLPAYEHEIPLVLQDRRLTGKGQLGYDTQFDDMFLGDVLLVNGKAWPHLEVERRKYRFRVLNGSNTRNYTLQLADGSLEFQQIGSDLGFLNSPVTLRQLTLSPGERADIIIDFAQPGLSGGDDIILVNTHPSRPEEKKDETPIREVMQFRIRHGEVDDPVVLPAQLNVIQPLTEDQAVERRNFELEDFPDELGSKWLINGEKFDHVTEFVQNGSVEVWNWVNKSEMHHPMHIHLVAVQVLGRWSLAEDSKGNPVPGRDLGVAPGERGWKDTVNVGGEQLVRVIAKFDGVATGLASELFPYHCHVLEHEDHEMMRQFELRY